jgi:hypothetical protein
MHLLAYSDDQKRAQRGKSLFKVFRLKACRAEDVVEYVSIGA